MNKISITILFQVLHDGLDMISMKMPEKTHLEEAVHDGFDSLVESLSDRDELGSIIHDGLHDLSEQIGSKSDVSQVLFLYVEQCPMTNGHLILGSSGSREMHCQQISEWSTIL